MAAQLVARTTELKRFPGRIDRVSLLSQGIRLHRSSSGTSEGAWLPALRAGPLPARTRSQPFSRARVRNRHLQIRGQRLPYSQPHLLESKNCSLSGKDSGSNPFPEGNRYRTILEPSSQNPLRPLAKCHLTPRCSGRHPCHLARSWCSGVDRQGLRRPAQRVSPLNS
jgi:hypothetical protein